MEETIMFTADSREAGADPGLIVLTGQDIQSLLAGKELEIIECIKSAYRIHGLNDSTLPHSSFLLFPDQPRDRIIALPAYLGGNVNGAGIKWISSFPDNIHHGIDRASAVLILNSIETGRPKALLEGSIISAKRTAASAALAAQILRIGKKTVAGFIGCGVINFEIARFLRYTTPDVDTFLLFDLDQDRARRFQDRCESTFKGVNVLTTSSMGEVLGEATLISFATTASTPHVHDLKPCCDETVILHISLRDLAPAVILSSENVVDDIDHVCRANTSLHLTEQQVGNRQFVRCSLADVLNGFAEPRAPKGKIAVFSPFGLGVLDIALGEYALASAKARGTGQWVASFFPDQWDQNLPIASTAGLEPRQIEVMVR
jgi:ornithine cyclodeaminase